MGPDHGVARLAVSASVLLVVGVALGIWIGKGQLPGAALEPGLDRAAHGERQAENALPAMPLASEPDPEQPVPSAGERSTPAPSVPEVPTVLAGDWLAAHYGPDWARVLEEEVPDFERSTLEYPVPVDKLPAPWEEVEEDLHQRLLEDLASRENDLRVILPAMEWPSELSIEFLAQELDLDVEGIEHPDVVEAQLASAQLSQEIEQELRVLMDVATATLQRKWLAGDYTVDVWFTLWRKREGVSAPMFTISAHRSDGWIVAVYFRPGVDTEYEQQFLRVQALARERARLVTGLLAN